MQHGILDAKLEELSVTLTQMRERIDTLQNAEPEVISAEIQSLQRACHEIDGALQVYSTQGRLPALKALARAQVEFNQAAQETAEAFWESTPDAELDLLFAEFAIDFATYAAQRAQLAALAAIARANHTEEEES